MADVAGELEAGITGMIGLVSRSLLVFLGRVHGVMCALHIWASNALRPVCASFSVHTCHYAECTILIDVLVVVVDKEMEL